MNIQVCSLTAGPGKCECDPTRPPPPPSLLLELNYHRWDGINMFMRHFRSSHLSAEGQMCISIMTFSVGFFFPKCVYCHWCHLVSQNVHLLPSPGVRPFSVPLIIDQAVHRWGWLHVFLLGTIQPGIHRVSHVGHSGWAGAMSRYNSETDLYFHFYGKLNYHTQRRLVSNQRRTSTGLCSQQFLGFLHLVVSWSTPGVKSESQRKLVLRIARRQARNDYLSDVPYHKNQTLHKELFFWGCVGLEVKDADLSRIKSPLKNGKVCVNRSDVVAPSLCCVVSPPCLPEPVTALF